MTFDDLANFLLGRRMHLAVEWYPKERKWHARIQDIDTGRSIVALDDRLDAAIERAVDVARQVQP